MKILTDFDGANICVLKQEQNRFVIEPDMRDTDCDWFYWAFCAEGKCGETAEFSFEKPVRLGRFGAAVSEDLKNWNWLKSGDEYSFSYTFRFDGRVYFAHDILYPATRFARRFVTKELCTSEKGRSVPFATMGNGENTVLLTARHHCCESSGGYVLEGVASYLKDNLPPDLKLIVVPYVDYDGVCDGDQGKNRRPHDHNRDYADTIYSTVRAIKALTQNERILYAFDFHSPYYQGGRRDYPFIVHANEKPETVEFARLLEKETAQLAIKYDSKNDVKYGMEWNKKSDLADKCSKYFSARKENLLAFTLENPYFGTENYAVCEEYFLALGECFAKAFLDFHKMLDKQNRT